MRKISRCTLTQEPITAGPTRKAPPIDRKRPKTVGAAVSNFCAAAQRSGWIAPWLAVRTQSRVPDYKMKPAKFDYYDPMTLEEALTLLDTHQGDGKVLAGGQSLMPLLNMRLARPNIVVDINRIKELNYVRSSDGGIAVGALARQRALQTDKLIAERVPILQEAAYYIAHPQIRSRGTICGSIAHADPAAELPALALALDAEMSLTSAKAARTVGAETFFQSFLTTSLDANAILTDRKS